MTSGNTNPTIITNKILFSNEAIDFDQLSSVISDNRVRNRINELARQGQLNINGIGNIVAGSSSNSISNLIVAGNRNRTIANLTQDNSISFTPSNPITGNIINSVQGSSSARRTPTPSSTKIYDLFPPKNKSKSYSNGIYSINSNPLNRYIDNQYHIVFSMVDRNILNLIQRGNNTSNTIDIDELKVNTNVDRSTAIASTGDIFRRNPIPGSANPPPPASSGNGRGGGSAANVVYNYNYYNIDGLKIENIQAPSSDNPLLSQLISMRFQIVEPQGFNLRNDLEELAKNLGYGEVNPGRIIYRVDIYFSGFDHTTGEWTEVIDLNNSRNTSDYANFPKVISYYGMVSKLDAKTDHRGTVYEVDFVPSGYNNIRPEDFTFDANMYVSGKGLTFGSWLTKLGETLTNAKYQRVPGYKLLRRYEFYAPKILRDAILGGSSLDTIEKNFVGQNQTTGQTTAGGRSITILDILKAGLEDTQIAQELFINNENNEGFIDPRLMFNILFNTVYSTNTRNDIYDYSLITHQFIIYPFITFKKGDNTPTTQPKYVSPENQLERVNRMFQYGMVNRVYNYLNTGQNTEVIDLDLSFTNFYYETIPETTDDPNITGQYANNNVAKSGTIRNNINNENPNTKVRIIERDGQIFVEETTTTRSAGRVPGTVTKTLTLTNNQELSNTEINRFQRQGGGFNEKADSDYLPAQGELTPLKNRYVNALDEYLSLDLLNIKLSIRGDPIWLLSNYANYGIQPIEAEIVDAPGYNLKIIPTTDKVILLRLFPQSQDSYLNPNTSINNQQSKRPNIIGGFYGVTKVSSTFENGRFTQILEAYKMNHLNYVEDLLSVKSSGGN